MHPAMALSLDGSRLFVSYLAIDKVVLIALSPADGYVVRACVSLRPLGLVFR